MAWPSATVNTTYFDQSSDSPGQARPHILDMAQKVNAVINTAPGTFLFATPSTLTLSSELTHDTSTLVGRTGSGAAYVWDALDSVPSAATGIILAVRVNLSLVAAATAYFGGVSSAYGVAAPSPAGGDLRYQIAEISGRNGSATATMSATSVANRVVPWSGNSLAMRWYYSGATTYTFTAALLGYIKT